MYLIEVVASMIVVVVEAVGTTRVASIVTSEVIN